MKNRKKAERLLSSNMTLPIYLSDAAGRQFRSEKDYDYITQFMHQTVVDLVEAAGYTAVKNAVPDMKPEQANLDGYGGLILFGGYDVDSSFYEAQTYRSFIRGVDPTDEFELDLIYDAIRKGLPVLGICRGMQLINVAHGGTLHYDIGHLTKVQHNNFGAGAYEHRAVAHGVEVVRSSVLPDGVYSVASSHHQAVDAVGEELVVTAYSHDGIIEMVENPDRNIIGVQWHPEASHVKQSDTINPLIQAFLSKVPTEVVEIPEDSKPKFAEVNDLLFRFPIPVKPAETEENSTFLPPYYTSMGRPAVLFDDYADESIVGRHYFLDESDYTLQDDMYNERGGVQSYLEQVAMMDYWDEPTDAELVDGWSEDDVERDILEIEQKLEQQEFRELWA